jgi:hypothetical protein
MVIIFNVTKGEFVGEKQDYDFDVKTLGTEAMKMEHHWVNDVGKLLSEILPGGSEAVGIVGNMTYGEMKDKLSQIFMKGTPWTKEETALQKIDQTITESTILKNRVIIDVPTFRPLEYFEHFDARLTYEGKTYQAKNVWRIGCDSPEKNNIFILWDELLKPSTIIIL